MKEIEEKNKKQQQNVLDIEKKLSEVVVSKL